MKSRIDKLEYRCVININKDIWYYKNNEIHRDGDIPALIWKSGARAWYKNGQCHRDNDKPSTIFPDGRMFWYENNICIKDNLDEIKNR